MQMEVGEGQEDMEKFAGGPVGIHIFNAKERKQAELQASAAGACSVLPQNYTMSQHTVIV